MKPPFDTKPGPEVEGWAIIGDNVLIENGDLYVNTNGASDYPSFDKAYKLISGSGYTGYRPTFHWRNASIANIFIYRKLPDPLAGIVSRRSPIPLNLSFSERLPLP